MLFVDNYVLSFFDDNAASADPLKETTYLHASLHQIPLMIEVDGECMNARLKEQKGQSTYSTTGDLGLGSL